ncbi:uncharacterized protein LOC120408110 [Mauremys reevesii]|uniref:uncharacterized protein LOC120408110 n=1 Tax=Mauremys reevesii TaxID=260615 RepID=UPI00193F0D10|nr:uncharacterized protein LOC120408110 [Mauremys reevesii]XP_039400613.1 uncharacterized protein LOC120408110 [Mauremys reevesii]XP_039400614.1 uncharacterized protein LOC120408110 [Mauremys reevesii]XP_039400615.1 uncharacterized protein LOC120408110 [Mauremys reevesii]
MKKVLNANKTSSHVMRAETPEYEPSDTSNKYVKFSHYRQAEQYVPYTTANVPKTAGIQGINTKLPGRCTVQMHIHSSAIFEKADKDAARHRLLTIGRSEDHKTSHAAHKQEFLSYAKFFSSNAVCQSEVPSQQCRIRQRKTQQQLQKENQSATIIQSAWRGCQVRREINGMNKAAAKIQAVFRGYRTRRELLLGCNTHGKDEGLQLKKKRRAESKEKLFPLILRFDQQWGWDSRTLSNISKSDSLRSQHKTNKREGTFFIPIVIFPKVESSRKTKRKGFVLPSDLPTLNVFESRTQQHGICHAAIQIQAAWRGYQARKQMREIERQAKIKAEESQPFSNGCKNSPESCEKQPVLGAEMSGAVAEIQSSTPEQKDPVQEPEQDSSVKEEPSKESKGTNTEGSVPSVRNINIYTVVKGVPASRRPPITIRVSSPNAIVQGYHRDMSRGMQGLYTVKNHCDPRPSQIIVQIHMVEKEDNPSTPS